MPDQPVLRVIRGDASAEEIAAIVAVLALRAKTATGGPVPPRTVKIWADRNQMMREAISPSPGGWRRSAFPR